MGVTSDTGYLDIFLHNFFFNSATPVRFLILFYFFANHACCMKKSDQAQVWPCMSMMCVRACKINNDPSSILFLFEKENAPYFTLLSMCRC